MDKSREDAPEYHVGRRIGQVLAVATLLTAALSGFALWLALR